MSGEPPAPEPPREYRCPVCGHVDDVELEGRGEIEIRCTHCETALLVHLRAPDDERLAVRLAGDEASDG